ncbi:cellulase family glycosylhydrolase [Pseudomonas sp. HMWF021]|uniref:cellulase family glycosylhydrolase n=1 Tax=Pseudomonas sp. HMWF021 TaxID=2056857 RepID=UPI000D347774|nr:cellulase family glycosylhydrolase [Pseudomonas sp. HMWF021]PTT29229.1 glycosyl hydrolase family 5 [Pseudomonas sp. HMWF021]
MKAVNFKRLSVVTLLTLSATSQLHASELFPALSTKTVGAQVKIQNFSAADAARIKDTGFAFVRFGVWTDSLGAAAYQKQISEAFATARSAGLPVLLTVRATKPLTSNPGDPAQLTSAGEAFANAVTSLEKSYRTQLVAIELWNEPDLSTYWPTGNFDTTFVPFMSAACKTLQAAPPLTPVVGFGFARPPTAGSASTVALNRIVSEYPKCLNAVSYHPYGMTTTQISNAQAFIQQNFHLPGVISEWGISALSSNGGVDGQASKIVAFIADMKRLNIPLTSIYEWKNTDTGSNDREKNFGLLTSSGQPKPAESAVKTELNAQ